MLRALIIPRPPYASSLTETGPGYSEAEKTAPGTIDRRTNPESTQDEKPDPSPRPRGTPAGLLAERARVLYAALSTFALSAVPCSAAVSKQRFCWLSSPRSARRGSDATCPLQTKRGFSRLFGRNIDISDLPGTLDGVAACYAVQSTTIPTAVGRTWFAVAQTARNSERELARLRASRRRQTREAEPKPRLFRYLEL